MGEAYFVRSSPDAPEKGPFSRRQLARSHEKGLLGKQAVARLDGSEEWLPLKDVVASFPPKKAKRSGGANDAHALASVPRGRGVHPNVWIGVVVGLVGVGLSVGFAATGWSSSMWPVALIIGGLYVTVKGVIRGPLREDE